MNYRKMGEVFNIELNENFSLEEYHQVCVVPMLVDNIFEVETKLFFPSSVITR